MMTPSQGGGCSTAFGIDSGYCEEGDTGGMGSCRGEAGGVEEGRGAEGLGSAERGPGWQLGAGARSLITRWRSWK